MEIRLVTTKYGSFVAQLGDLPAFKGRFGMSGGKWYSTIEEARREALEYFEVDYSNYKRNCAGKTTAAKAMQVLSEA